MADNSNGVQTLLDFIARYSMFINSISSYKNLGGAQYIPRAIGKLTTNGVLTKDQLFTKGKTSYWTFSEEEAEERKYIPDDLEPSIPGFSKGNDRFIKHERYATLMFCCGSSKQRTLLSSTEVSKLLKHSGSKLFGSDSMYIDHYLREKTGHPFIGHIQVDGGGKGSSSQICTKIRARAKSLFNTESTILREAIDEKLFVLTYLCQSARKAKAIEKELDRTKDSAEPYGIWINVCPIEELQNTIEE